MITIQPAALADFAGAILAAAGAPGDIAARMAQSLVGANLAGHDSHGVIRIPQYLTEIERGQVDPAARPEVAREGPAWALVDGKWAFGQETARFAMEQAIQRAGPMGVGFASAIHCNHIGRVGQWVEQAAAAQMVGAAGVAITGGTATRVAPFGGAAGVLSTNPLAIAAPRPEVRPCCSTSRPAASPRARSAWRARKASRCRRAASWIRTAVRRPIPTRSTTAASCCPLAATRAMLSR